MKLHADDSVSEEELLETLQEELAALLGVHESQVEFSILDGVALYTITSDDAELASDLQDVLSQPTTAGLLEDAVSATLPVQIRDVSVDGGIVADVV
eukprot:UN20445